jgi:large subunit ribosomal protein L15
MARRIRSRGKKKFLGNRTHGGGNAKNRRGKGSRGGVGRAGFHKHKWLQTIKRGEIHGEKGFVNPSPSSRKRSKLREINLGALQREIDSGKHAADASGVYALSLRDCKVLSGGSLKAKIVLRAGGVSGKAKEKIVAAGGSVSTE